MSAPEGTPGDMIALALTSLAAFNAWRVGKTIEVVALEIPLVDGALNYGTRFDAVLRVDGVLAIYDWKSGKLYPEFVVAAAAYWAMWNKHNTEQVAEVVFVQCPTDGTEAVEVRVGLEQLMLGAVAFTALLTLDNLKKNIKLPKPVKHTAAVGGF